MVHYSLLLSLLATFVMVFSGCKKLPKYYDFVPSEFPQGQEPEDVTSIVKSNVRSVKIYNQFTTEALFDVLYFSDEVARKYADLYCARRGKSEAERNKLILSKISESKKTLTYYILADIRDNVSQSLIPKDSVWSVYLINTKGQKIEPSEIKEVELESELRRFFLHRYNRYKTAYKVTFSVTNKDKTLNFDTDERPSMVLNSVTQERTLHWNPAKSMIKKHEKTKVIKSNQETKDEDFYWL